AVMAETLTDNRNRTGPEMRSLFSKAGGEIGKSGCVSYLFDRKGLFVFDAATIEEEQLMEVALEHGGDDVETTDEGKYQVTCSPEVFDNLRDAFEASSLVPEIKEVTRLPQTMVDADASVGKQVVKLLQALDEHDDVQTVSTNLNITDELISE
ncbi:MAG: YebC/PmpR family DNA-binding transcriptional regulator, partial [Rubripirellula sp.]